MGICSHRSGCSPQTTHMVYTPLASPLLGKPLSALPDKFILASSPRHSAWVSSAKAYTRQTALQYSPISRHTCGASRAVLMVIRPFHSHHCSIRLSSSPAAWVTRGLGRSSHRLSGTRHYCSFPVCELLFSWLPPNSWLLPSPLWLVSPLAAHTPVPRA